MNTDILKQEIVNILKENFPNVWVPLLENISNEIIKKIEEQKK